MQDDLAAEVARLNLPASTADYSKEDWARHNEVVHAWFDRQNEPPLGGGVQITDLTAGSPTFGKSQTYSQSAMASQSICRSVARTRTRARSSLRSGRPSCSRRTSSRSSASSGEPEQSDEPAPPRAALLSYACLAPPTVAR
jgi:hypothetical protein